MSLWWNRTVDGKRSILAIEGLGLVVCLAIVIVIGLVAWLCG